jgi:hypothetical protein
MWRRASVIVGLILILLLVISACGLELSSEDGESSGLAADPFNDVSNSLDTNTNFEPEAPATGESGSEQTQRIVIKSATLSITVKSVSEKVVSISTLAEGMGGWVVTSTVRGNDEQRFGSIAIRIPAEQFNAALESIKSDVEEVDSEQINGEDVTDEFTDLQSRLRNLQAAESQMQTFLEDAQDTDEVLKVYNELVSLREDIEVAQGRINLLQDSASFSSITVTLSESFEDDQDDDENDDPWKPGETISSAFSSLVVALRGVVDIAIWLLIFAAPLALVVGIPSLIGWRLFGKKIWRERMPTPPDEE